jgi:hypothetical protein
VSTWKQKDQSNWVLESEVTDLFEDAVFGPSGWVEHFPHLINLVDGRNARYIGFVRPVRVHEGFMRAPSGCVRVTLREAQEDVEAELARQALEALP